VRAPSSAASLSGGAWCCWTARWLGCLGFGLPFDVSERQGDGGSSEMTPEFVAPLSTNRKLAFETTSLACAAARIVSSSFGHGCFLLSIRFDFLIVRECTIRTTSYIVRECTIQGLDCISQHRAELAGIY
jgi:hypothetical protein